MITQIIGRLVEKTPTQVVVDCNGVGYAVHISLNTYSQIGDEEKIKLFTHMQVREDSHTLFGLEPVVAMLSFSNFGSSRFPQAQKVSKAVSILHRSDPDLIVDGPIQADFALNKELLESGFPFSGLRNKKVNVLVFPNLEQLTLLIN